jgi:hypothetical protein
MAPQSKPNFLADFLRILRFGRSGKRGMLVREAFAGEAMSIIEKEDGKLPYGVPVLTVLGTLESITRQDTDGHRFDANFVIGQVIPPNIAS